MFLSVKQVEINYHTRISAEIERHNVCISVSDEAEEQANFCYCNVKRNLKLKQQYACANNSNFIKTPVELF